jgi:sedoheptulose-bisphosphatase
MGSLAQTDGPAPSLAEHIASILPKDGSRTALGTSVIPSLLRPVADIAKALRLAHEVSHAGTANTFGDEQLNVDVIAENHIRDAISLCPSIRVASSEEDPVERRVTHHPSVTNTNTTPSKEAYTIAFDPLDGSSIIKPNWTVGTIIGVWDSDKSALFHSPKEKQIAAILGVFGPRTTAIVAVRVPGSEPNCFEVGYVQDETNTSAGAGTWEIIRRDVRILPAASVKTRHFAPANLRAAAEDPKYMSLVQHYIGNKYTLRYSGGLVPDVVHMLVMGYGVYLSPVTEKSRAKLRRLYELCPLALVVECAGGKAVDPVDGRGILETEVRGCDERGGLVCGAREEVEGAVKVLGGLQREFV